MNRDPEQDRFEDDARALRDVVRVPRRETSSPATSSPATGSRGGPHFDIDKLPANTDADFPAEELADDTDLPPDEDDLEAAYLRALEASENVAGIVAEFEPVDPLLDDDALPVDDSLSGVATAVENAPNDVPAVSEPIVSAPVLEDRDLSHGFPIDIDSNALDAPQPEIPEDTPADTIVWASEEDESNSEPPAAHHELTTAAIAAGQSPANSPASTGRAAPVVRVGSEVEPANDAATVGKVVHPHQVIEAALFVDGPIPARKICTLLGGSFEPAFVELAVEQLNTSYLNEGRPFEILITDGGYHLQLRREYDYLRHRVFGTGPREVKLGQDLLEVLAIVAYRQPVTVDELDGVRKSSSAGSLRQLLRRDLVCLERDAENPKRVLYRTTARFLNLFGLGSIDELPRTEDVDSR